jgi:hypothetical protein
MALRAKAPNGKIVIVFGASRGLGKGIAIGLAKEAGLRRPYKISAPLNVVDIGLCCRGRCEDD